MAGRPVRSGSVLIVTLLVSSLLGGLLLVELLWWEKEREGAENAADFTRLQNEAESVLERTTAWLASERPGNPADGGFRVLSLADGASPSELEISVPPGVLAPSPRGIAVSVTVQWCRYSPGSALKLTGGLDWPPALAQPPEDGEKPFSQTFEQAVPRTASAGASHFAAWRVCVRASAGKDEDGDLRSVFAERVVLVGP